MSAATDRSTTTDEILENASWWGAIPVRERLAGRPTLTAGAPDRALRRLERWRRELAVDGNADRLESYVDILGTDLTGLTELLAERTVDLAARIDGPPAVADRVAAAFATADGPGPPGFLRIGGPLLQDGERRIRVRIAAAMARRPSAHVDAQVLATALCVPPWSTLATVVERTMVLELNVLRVQGRLTGDTADERFRDFIDMLADPRCALTILAEYPVMAGDLVRVIDHWVEARSVFAEHLLADVDTMAELLPGTLGDFTSVAFGAGDVHRGGRSVGVVEFGTGRRIVYKPRSLAVEKHFQELLEWLNQRGADPHFRALAVLDRGDRGWVEFVPSSPCSDEGELSRFHRRQGAYVAILHALAATDFHWENIIAAGEHPVPIDLEALFHTETPVAAGTHASDRALRMMKDSVLGVGILPSPATRVDDGRVIAFDISGLSGAEGQQSPDAMPGWAEVGTDTMHLVRERRALGRRDNRARIAGRDVDALDFADDLVSGFRSMGGLLAAHRDCLLAPDGPVAAFADDEVRVILRPTQSYARLMQEAHHPDLLRDQLDRDRFFSILMLDTRFPVRQADVVRSEYAQLVGGDVPVFSTTPRSTDVVSGDGILMRDLLPVSGLDRARERISAFGPAELERQAWFLECSLTALAMGHESARWPSYSTPHAARPAPAADFLTAATGIGDRLLETAVRDGESLTWLGLTLVDDKVWRLTPAPVDLYSGTSGTALFLARLGAATGEQRFTDAARRGVDEVVRRIEHLPDPADRAARAVPYSIGAFTDLGGSVYALSHLSALWGRPDLARTAACAVPHLAAQAQNDDILDVISGSAGGVMALLALHSVDPSAGALATASAFAARLRSRAGRDEGGVSWISTINPTAALAGFSHGASGIAVALARLDAATTRPDHRDLVEGALAFESAVFDEGRGNWADRRETATSTSTLSAWCHGAPGIGLARAELVGHVDAELLRTDLERAVTSTLGLGLCGPELTGMGNHSICHGDLGNLECLDAMARALDDRALSGRVGRLRAAVLGYGTTRGWLCGVPLGVETPGLMCGLAGIGDALLRIAEPALAPSVLAVEGPVGS